MKSILLAVGGMRFSICSVQARTNLSLLITKIQGSMIENRHGSAANRHLRMANRKPVDNRQSLTILSGSQRSRIDLT
jgi:hypothetical protein